MLIVVWGGGIEPSLRVRSKRHGYEAKAVNSHEGDGAERKEEETEGDRRGGRDTEKDTQRNRQTANE